jgi:hypothetical protein
MIKFIDDNDRHDYVNEKEEKYISATTIIDKYHKKFPKEFMSHYCALKKVDKYFDQNKSRYYQRKDKPLELLLAVLPDYIDKDILDLEAKKLILEWAKTNKDSLSKGTELHLEKENSTLSKHKEEFAGIKYQVNQKNNFTFRDFDNLSYHDLLQDGYHPELRLWNHDLKLAGTADIVIIETDKFGDRWVSIGDFKSNREIKMENKYDKMLFPLNKYSDCVEGNTKLLTKNGIEIIKECVNKEIEIWNGEEWSNVTPFITGTKKELYRVFFSDGSFLDVTEGHKFLIKYRLDKGFEEQNTFDIIKKMSTTKWLPRLPNSNIENFEGVDIKGAYEYGFVLGDGSINKNEIRVSIYTDSKKLNFENVKSIVNTKKTYSVRFDLDLNICKQIKYDEGLPKYLFSWSKESILKFVSGWLDADGSLVKRDNSVRLYGNQSKLQDCQLLLTKCNIKSNLSRMSKKGDVTNLGIRKNDVWYLTIYKTGDLFCQRLPLINKEESKKGKKWQFIKKIEKLEGLHTTYCLTENKLNQCVFNNVLTKQCNYNHYTLQLSLYAYLLELMGFKVKHLRLIWINELGDEIPYVLNYKKQDVINMIEHYNNNK